MTFDPNDPNQRGEIYSPEATDGRTDWPSLIGAWAWFFIVLAAVGVLVGFCAPVHARDPSGQWATSPWHAWFDAQHDLNGRSCCLWADGHLYTGAYTLNADGSVTIKDGPAGPVTLPKSEVLLWGATEISNNPTGEAVWWWTQAPTLAFSYCFALRQPQM